MNFCSFGYNNKNFFYQLRDETDTAIFQEIFIRQDYRVAHQIIKETKNPIIDAGAHVGFFSLLCYCFNQNIPIYAIEPEPSNFETLTMHVTKNKIPTIIPIKGALSSTDGQKILECNKESIRHKIVEENNERKNQKKPTTIKGYVFTPGFSLKTLMQTHRINHIGLLKMDIEGGEYDILLNLENEIRTYIDAIILEYHTIYQKKYTNPKTLIALMRSKGFSVQHFPSQYEKTLGFLFGRNKRKKSQ